MKSNWKELIGYRLKIEISDPWEVAGILNNIQIFGTIKNIKEDALLIKLDNKMEINNCILNYLIALNRDVVSFNKVNKTGVNLIAIQPVDEDQYDLFETAKKYRGGCEYIGSVQWINKKLFVSKVEIEQIEKQQIKWELEKKIDTARKIAEDSWKNHNYRELISAYKPIIDYLSPLEMKKYQYAIKKSKGPNKN